MSRSGSALALLGKFPTVLRTLVHLRPAQGWAQIRHLLFGTARSGHGSGPAPGLAIEGPHTRFLDPPAHVKASGTGRIELLGTTFELADPIDWDTNEAGMLFAYHLHQHEYLRLSEFPAKLRGSHLRDWIRHHRSGVGWDPHPTSLRLLCWGKLLSSPNGLEVEVDSSLREEVLRSMSGQADLLAGSLEIRLQANHLLSNLLAVVFTGLVLEGSASRAWLELAPALIRELDRQIRPDGGHEERSPMYQALILESVLDLLNLCQSKPARAPNGLPDALRATALRMFSALELMTHPDGRIALFADSAFDICAEPSALRDYARRLGMSIPSHPESRHLPQTGYLRLRSGAFDLIASVAGPSPPHQPGHAHCDALAFELSVDGERLVTDTGLFEYRPGRRRDRARRTASHSTLQFDGEEQAEIWAAHRVGGRPSVELTAWDDSGSAEATCRGWSRRAPLHRRFFSVGDLAVSIVDRVEGRFSEVRQCIPFDPNWSVELESDVARATRRFPDGRRSIVEIALAEGFQWSLERAFYYPTFGREVDRFELVGVASECGEATTRFRRLE